MIPRYKIVKVGNTVIFRWSPNVEIIKIKAKYNVKSISTVARYWDC